MHVRRFVASTTAEAVREIREELGDDALVLSVRKVRQNHGPFGLFSKPAVEVTALRRPTIWPKITESPTLQSSRKAISAVGIPAEIPQSCVRITFGMSRQLCTNTP